MAPMYNDKHQQRGELFIMLFDHAAVSMVVVLADGTLLRFNRAFCMFLGYSEKELLKLNIFDFTFPADRELTAARFRKSISGKNPTFQYEKRYLRKDGGIVWGLVSGSWVLDGSEAYGVAFIQDITERKSSEAELHASAARYRRLFETNPLPMWIFDRQTLQFLAVNDAAIAHYGYSREQFLAMTIKAIRPPETVPALLESLARMGDTDGQDQACHQLRDGRRIEVEIHAHNVDFDGRSARVVQVHDVTEKRRTEERMRLDAAALKSTRDAILIIDRTLCILSVNPAFTEMTGYSDAEILGKHPRILSSSRHDPDFFKDILAHLRINNYWQGEFLGRHKTGAMFPGWLTLTMVHNAEGKPTHFVGVITDLTKQKKSEERLQYLAHYDPLTDLPNRQLLESMLLHALERAHRDGKWLALLVLGLDQFKTINESFGHETGDGLLVSLVQRLRGQMHKGHCKDALTRLAGDQFALILEGIQDHTDIELVVRHVQTLLEAPFMLRNGHRVYLRGSIGISVSPQNGSCAQELLRGAEAAVYLAKERGGNQFCFCSPEVNSQARTRLELQSELGQALERQEFFLHYQPKVDLRSGRIVGAEALLRWVSPTRGLISPLQFIPLAEKSGLIVPLGAWVIQQVCGQIRRWREAGLEKIGVAVNVSARQFRSGNLEELVAAALQDHGLEPQCLMLELTESMLMDDPEEAVNRLAGLRRTGVRIALDDFGTGYSSLGYLGRFPIDQLKIDRSFITDITTDPKSATIATSIIGLAHRMRLRVVAEGVETQAQLGYLRQYGCDELQGYYFSKPLTPEAFAELLLQGRALPTQQEDPEVPTLLLVDDEPNILTALGRLLNEEGYRVLTANSGRAGLELLAQHAVQVIITDQRMPEMSGTEFLRRVKALHPNTVRLILSGYADLPTVTESVNEGALYKFLAKPWDNDHLCEQIREAFGFFETNVKPLRAAAGGH